MDASSAFWISILQAQGGCKLVIAVSFLPSALLGPRLLPGHVGGQPSLSLSFRDIPKQVLHLFSSNVFKKKKRKEKKTTKLEVSDLLISKLTTKVW